MIKFDSETKCKILYTSQFKKQIKKFVRQNRKLNGLLEIINKLANFEKLDPKHRDHNLIDDKTYKSCRECHISPDWILIYKYLEDKLILLLVATGSHSDLFR